ncbi:hypothetical protein LTR64_007456 [Lithohypha guttulata]|uniref:uncharacterized protein n=1 Tax=Lithohypha guttulata TaxID=1690604 RepID=UPI002DE1C644|nr:hypothetical protein LTR51_006778 [Lithohypha guttulata]
MRPYLYIALLGASLTGARNIISLPDHQSKLDQIPPPPQQLHARSEQSPMASRPENLGPAIPDQSTGSGSSSSDSNQLTISDILPTQRQINIFASLTRDISSLSGRLESSNAASNTTLLAPLNSAMQSLPRKPWEDRPDDTSDISAQRDEDKAVRNLRRFVLEHAVGVSPWEEKQKVRTLWSEENGEDRGEIWWERRGGGEDGGEERRVIMPCEVVVERVVGRVGNEVYKIGLAAGNDELFFL